MSVAYAMVTRKTAFVAYTSFSLWSMLCGYGRDISDAPLPYIIICFRQHAFGQMIVLT